MNRDTGVDGWVADIGLTAVVPTPSVSSVSPTTMTADGVSHTLTIFGSNLQSGNIVQFKWGVGAGSGVWNTGNTPTINSSTQITVSMNPGTVNDTIYVRVCSTSSATACSSGTHSVTVTAEMGIPATDGFDYPIGARTRYTEASDGDGWYVALEFNEFYSGNGKYHLGEDWNAESGGNTDYGLPEYRDPIEPTARNRGGGKRLSAERSQPERWWLWHHAVDWTDERSCQ